MCHAERLPQAGHLHTVLRPLLSGGTCQQQSDATTTNPHKLMFREAGGVPQFPNPT